MRKKGRRSALTQGVLAIGLLSHCGHAHAQPALAPVPSETPKHIFTQARVIRDSAQDVMVELLTRSAEGVLTSLARDPLPPTPVSVITIAGGPEAWVRFSTPDRAPLTVRADDVQAPEGWRLPELRAGGELFLTFEPGRLPPIFYQLSGPFLADVHPRDGNAALHGLPPGSYEVTPVYEGWFKGEPQRVTVVAAQTTPALIAHESVGAAVITARDDICASAETFILVARLVWVSPTRMPRRGEILQTTDVAACRWRVGGLPRGTYQALLRGERRQTGGVEFNVAPDQTTEVAIEAPPVTVSGVVTTNDQPVRDATILVQGSNTMSTVQVQSDGTYEITLDKEGEYTVSMRAPGSKGVVRRATFRRGENRLDFANKTVDTELTIRVSGADPSAKVDLEIRSADNVVLTSMDPGETTTTRRALAYGTHRIVARQPGATSELHTVELSPERLTAAVELSLTRNSRHLTLRYGDGEPVSHASFSGVIAAPEEVVPGTYSLATIATGTELVIKPPSGSPLCRLVHAQGDVHVAVDAGRSLTFQFEDPRVTADNVRIATGSTADCPVPLGRFLKTSFSAGPERSRRVEVLNAPSENVLTLYTPGGVQQVIVAADGLVIVPSSR